MGFPVSSFPRLGTVRQDPQAGIRWGSILALSTTVMAAFGILFYGFSVYLTDAAAGSVFSATTLSAGYSGAVLSGALLAMPIGRYADRRGVRPILGLGSVLGFAGMTAFATAEQPWQVVAAWWLLIGPAGAMTFYEPAFVAIAQWCTPDQRPRALAVLTVVGGLAGVIFIPGTERLVAAIGWRPSAVILGGLLLAIGGSTSLFMLPKWSSVAHLKPAPRSPSRPIRRLVGERAFGLYTVALMLSFFAAQGVLAHRVALFGEAGFAIGVVAVWAAIASALSLPGRWLAPLIATRLRATTVQAAVTAILAVATALMVGGRSPLQMTGHFVFFGLGFGALLPLRAMVMANWYGGPDYGRIMGAQWTAVGLAGAAGPVVVGVLRDQTGGYGLAAGALAAIYVAVAGLVLLAGAERHAPAHGETVTTGA